MSAALAAVALTGAGQVADAALQVILWLLAAAVPVAVVIAAVRSWKRAAAFLRSEHLPPAVPCPCCRSAGGPLESDDCTCREDCGIPRCQAADVIDDALPRFFEHGERKADAGDLQPYAADDVLEAIRWMNDKGGEGR